MLDTLKSSLIREGLPVQSMGMFRQIRPDGERAIIGYAFHVKLLSLAGQPREIESFLDEACLCDQQTVGFHMKGLFHALVLAFQEKAE